MGSTFGGAYLAGKRPSGVAEASTAQPERPAPAVGYSANIPTESRDRQQVLGLWLVGERLRA